ncbi:Diaminopimelate epimerase-like protein [Mycena maculata]|uniref:Diaminopimelate epimerase-like protein n=1 Tax=Mycena maculata TaxID=230809 RepID=A0AAD7JK54_9AGAR|nr:Diaminopimelate epimerase-like protein [Mycena maculata]
MSPTQLAYTVYDAFTARWFGGNPAAVIILKPDHGLDDAVLQLIGRQLEFNLSEMAFLIPLDDHREDAPHFSLRWFTPSLEAPLCGHATLAAACHLHAVHPELQPPYRFESRVSGELKVGYHAASDLYELDFPLAQGEIKAVSQTRRGYLIEVAETVDVSTVVHDSTAIAREVPVGQCVLTGPHAPTAEDPTQVHSRMFACGSGIDEDPVTGSAHTRIVPCWLTKWGGNLLKCRQVSARGGELDTEWLRDEGRMLLRGHGVKMAKGVLFV